MTACVAAADSIQGMSSANVSEGGELVQYDAAEAWCHSVVAKGHELLFDLEKFHVEMGNASRNLCFPFESLHSLLRNHHVTFLKRQSHQIKSRINGYLQEYSAGTSIVDLAKDANYPPYMFARLIVEHVVVDMLSNKKAVTEAMRDPEGRLGDANVVLPQFQASEMTRSARLNDSRGTLRVDQFSHHPLPSSCHLLSRLATEVLDAINSDPLYGPRHDRERHSIGIEYEILLEQALSTMGVPFETETQLRKRGTARTPDILLSCPVGVKVSKNVLNSKGNKHSNAGKSSMQISDEDDDFEWKVVCWIDSKALFGDVLTHNTMILPQVETYVHRFGPGLVLYWFGHAPLQRLGDGHGDVVVCGWELPDFFLLPTGEFVGHDPHSPSNP